MTNGEKFKEVFGFIPTGAPIHPESCEEMDCEKECPCYPGIGKQCQAYWDKEYVSSLKITE